MKLGILRSDLESLRAYLRFGAAGAPTASDDAIQKQLELLRQRRSGAGGAQPDRVRGVLVDIDGTLLDSNDAHARAWIEALEGVGVSLPFEKVRPLIGMGAAELLSAVAGIDAESDVGKAASAKSRAVFSARYLGGLKPTRGARALIERMRARGLVVVAASSAVNEELDARLTAAGVRDLVEPSATSADAEASQPDPDVLGAAVRRSGLPPGELVMLGDTPYDIAAASALGIATVALRSGGASDDELAGALRIYDDPAALLEDYERSPFGAHPASVDA